MDSAYCCFPVRAQVSCLQDGSAGQQKRGPPQPCGGAAPVWEGAGQPVRGGPAGCTAGCPRSATCTQCRPAGCWRMLRLGRLCSAGLSPAAPFPLCCPSLLHWCSAWCSAPGFTLTSPRLNMLLLRFCALAPARLPDTSLNTAGGGAVAARSPSSWHCRTMLHRRTCAGLLGLARRLSSSHSGSAGHVDLPPPPADADSL